MAPDTFSLASKTAIVTGSGRETGIGAAIARALARNGAAVTIHHFSPESASRATKVAEEIQRAGGKAAVVQADVQTPEGAQKIVTATLKAFGVDKIDILGKS
jgi:NAD(P)-dependent dehydrogenase (short-subunit alcohol dehydrogenase family)